MHVPSSAQTRAQERKREQDKWSLQYAWLTVKHKYFVFLAGRDLGLGCWQLLITIF